MHFIRYKPDSLNYLIPKFEPNRTSSSRDTAIFVVFYTLGTKKHEKVGYLWNYSSNPAQILGASSWDCPTCTLRSAFTPKSITSNGKTGVQLEWQCPTFASLSCIKYSRSGSLHPKSPHHVIIQGSYLTYRCHQHTWPRPTALGKTLPKTIFIGISKPSSFKITTKYKGLHIFWLNHSSPYYVSPSFGTHSPSN